MFNYNKFCANTNILAHFRVYINQMSRYNKRKMLFDTKRNFEKNKKLIWLLNFTCLPTKIESLTTLKKTCINRWVSRYGLLQTKTHCNSYGTKTLQAYYERTNEWIILIKCDQSVVTTYIGKLKYYSN